MIRQQVGEVWEMFVLTWWLWALVAVVIAVLWWLEDA